MPRGEEQEERQRVHADALEPAQVARDEAGDLGEEEAAAGAERGDDERGPELVAPERGPDGTERCAEPDEGEEADQRERGGDRLSGDGENREGDDRRRGSWRDLATALTSGRRGGGTGQTRPT